MTEDWVSRTASDPPPPVGTVVTDATGREWVHIESGYGDSTYWVPTDGFGTPDPESWTKVAGNYGPVRYRVEGT